MIYDVIIIGGGASGMMCAIQACKRGKSVLILEHNEKLGKKLYITGKGRCNFTNNSSIDNHLNNIVNNRKFMYSALNAFSPADTMNFFASNLKIKTEHGNRVFPLSDKSSDIIKSLKNNLKGVDIILNCEIKSVRKINGIFYIKCINDVKYTSYSLVVATGGVSYPSTGASDFGYVLAKKFGHNVIVPRPALVPIKLNEDITSLNGLSLNNVCLSVKYKNKIYSQFGEMMFTYDSITGPIALTLSSLINKFDLNNLTISIDFKPALTDHELSLKFIREFPQYVKKDLKTYLMTILPHRFAEYLIDKNYMENKKISELTREERVKLINYLKKFDFSIKSLDNVHVGIVTAGGVDTHEINSSTCESNLVENLYFVGEVLDLDALTGGYNLQIAWSTGYLAGISIKGAVEK